MIQDSVREPGSYSTIKSSGANNTLPSTRQEMLIIAQRLTAGTIAKNIPTRIYSPTEAATYSGAGSIFHRMAIAAFKANPYLILTGCFLDDASTGVASTSTHTFTGTATATGSLGIKVGVDRINLAIDKAKTGANVATMVAAEINKYPSLPITAAAVDTVVTYTAKNKGTCGNLLGKYNPSTSEHELLVVNDAPGISVAVTGFTGGANDPTSEVSGTGTSLTDAFTAVASHRYHNIVIPFIDATAVGVLADHVDLVSDDNHQLGTRGFVFISQTLASATTLAAENAKRLVFGFIRRVCRPSYENAASLAASESGKAKPWLASNNDELVGCDTPDVQDRLTQGVGGEIDSCLWSGVTPFKVGAGDKVRCVRLISTYTKNDANTPDPTFLDSFKIATADYVREAIKTSQETNYPNAILKDKHVDGEPDNIVTPEDIRSNNIAVCKRIEKEGGLNDVDFYKDRFTSVKDPNVAGRVNSKIPIDIVDAAHILANDIVLTSKF